jgi:hypothetical protein
MTHYLAVALVTVSLFAFLGILAALMMSIFLPASKIAELLTWIGGYVFALAVIVLQSSALDYNTYSVGWIQTDYNYREQFPEFAQYLDKYEGNSSCNLASSDFSAYVSKVNTIRKGQGSGLPDAWFEVGPRVTENTVDPYFVRYKVKPPGDGSVYTDAWVASCAFDWDNLALRDEKFATNPCKFTISDGDADSCIGGWTGSSFKAYWCHLWEQAEEDRKFSEGNPTLGDYQKRQLVWMRDLDVIDSPAAFYRHNMYLLGINVAALIASAASVVLDFLSSRGNTGNSPTKTPEKEKQESPAAADDEAGADA